MTRLIALALPLLLAACAGAPAPSAEYFAPTAAQLGPELNGYGEAVLPRDALIVVQGDDLAYGAGLQPTRNRINGASQGQASMTISESLRQVLGKGPVRVENRGFPGDTVTQSTKRWAGAPPAALVILAFGVADMRAHTTAAEFGGELRALIRQAHQSGAAVFVVSAPPSANILTNANLAPYSYMAEVVARQEGAEVFSAAAAMATGKQPPAKGEAQSPRTYLLIAGAMAPYIRLVAPAA